MTKWLSSMTKENISGFQSFKNWNNENLIFNPFDTQ